MQWEFVIDGLISPDIAPNIKIQERIWLKENEIFLEKKEDKLVVFILGNENDDSSHIDERILPFVKVSSLFANNAPTLKGGGGGSIQSREEFGEKKLSLTIREMPTVLPKQTIKEIEQHAPTFLKQIITVHDEYIPIINKNQFLEIALGHFHDSQVKSVYTNDGFINVMMSLEALYNDGESDIRYKLTQRASFLLGLAQTDLSPAEVSEELKKAYNYRSKLVHGGKVPIAPNLDRYKISSYARLSIILMSILLKNPKRKTTSKDRRKKELLNEIDNAMLICSKRRPLEDEITNCLQDFKLQVPARFTGTYDDGSPLNIVAW